LGENAVSALYDGVAYNVGVGVGDDEGVESTVHEAEFEHIAWADVFEVFEEKFGRQLRELDDVVTLLLSRRILAFHTLGALVLEREGYRLVPSGSSSSLTYRSIVNNAT
jgi:hypothetical protein